MEPIIKVRVNSKRVGKLYGCVRAAGVSTLWECKHFWDENICEHYGSVNIEGGSVNICEHYGMWTFVNIAGVWTFRECEHCGSVDTEWVWTLSEYVHFRSLNTGGVWNWVGVVFTHTEFSHSCSVQHNGSMKTTGVWTLRECEDYGNVNIS